MSTPPTPPSGDAPLPPSGDTAPAPQMQTTQPTQVGGAPAKSGKGKLIGIIVGVLLIVGIAVAAVVILPSLAKAKNKALAIKAKGEEKIQPDGLDCLCCYFISNNIIRWNFFYSHGLAVDNFSVSIRW